MKNGRQVRRRRVRRRAAVASGVEPPERPRSTPSGRSGERARPRRGGPVGGASAAEAGRGGARESISPPQMFDPRVACFGDPDLEAAEAGLELTVRRDLDDEGV